MSEFVEYLHEVFRTFGPISARRMFGGHGVYHDGLMFGLIADDVLYLKADNESEPRFQALGLTPFEYVKNGKAMKMSYYAAPEVIYDDEDAAKEWGRLAFEAALRSGTKRKPRKKTHS